MKDRLFTIVLSVASTLGVVEANKQRTDTLEVDRLIVRKELIVSDSGEPWEAGFEKHQIARGLYARSLFDGPGGLWVRSRLIKGEIDDPFDDRFHALERNGSRRGSPGHISWNIWADDNWRQLAIIQGEALEENELGTGTWSGGNHPGRLRFQSFRPNHEEPLTDAVLGQGKMSLGGGGYGGGGLPYPKSVLELWGGTLSQKPLVSPDAPVVLKDDGSGPHEYTLTAVSAQQTLSDRSAAVKSNGRAQLRWNSVPGADAYIIARDGSDITGPLRIEGSQKVWTDELP